MFHQVKGKRQCRVKQQGSDSRKGLSLRIIGGRMPAWRNSVPHLPALGLSFFASRVDRYLKGAKLGEASLGSGALALALALLSAQRRQGSYGEVFLALHASLGPSLSRIWKARCDVLMLYAIAISKQS